MSVNKESFEYELGFQLSYMMDRSLENKSYVGTILKMKNHILNDEPLSDHEKSIIHRLLDDCIIINEICKNNDGFGRFLFHHSDLDAYLPENK